MARALLLRGKERRGKVDSISKACPPGEKMGHPTLLHGPSDAPASPPRPPTLPMN